MIRAARCGLLYAIVIFFGLVDAIPVRAIELFEVGEVDWILPIPEHRTNSDFKTELSPSSRRIYERVAIFNPSPYQGALASFDSGDAKNNFIASDISAGAKCCPSGEANVWKIKIVRNLIIKETVAYTGNCISSWSLTGIFQNNFNFENFAGLCYGRSPAIYRRLFVPSRVDLFGIHIGSQLPFGCFPCVPYQSSSGPPQSESSQEKQNIRPDQRPIGDLNSIPLYHGQKLSSFLISLIELFLVFPVAALGQDLIYARRRWLGMCCVAVSCFMGIQAVGGAIIGLDLMSVFQMLWRGI